MSPSRHRAREAKSPATRGLRRGEEETKARVSASELAGGATALLAFAVVAGWLSNVPRVVQLHPDLAPMQFNTALGLLLAGAGHVLLARRPRWAAAAALAAVALGLFTGLQHVLPLDLGIDELFLRHDVTVKTSSPGRMAPPTALALVLAGATLLLARSPLDRDRRELWTALASVTLVAIGVGTLLGYGARFEIPYGWRQATHMALHTAVATTLLGGAGLDVALRPRASHPVQSPRWAPWCAGWLVVALSIGLAHALWATQRAILEETLSDQVKVAVHEVLDPVERLRGALRRMGRRWEMRPFDPVEEADEARIYLNHHAEVAAIIRMSPARDVRWLASRGERELDAARALASLSPNAMAGDASIEMVDLAPEARGLALTVPLGSDGSPSGFLIAVLDVPGLTSHVSERATELGYAFTLFEGSRQLLSRGESLEGETRRSVALPLGSANLYLILSPGPELARTISPALPGGVLGGGLVVALLLGSSIHFAQVSKSRERALEAAAAELQGQRERLERTVAERTRELMEANALLRIENAERQKAERRARSRAEELTVMHGLTRVVTASYDVSEIYGNLMAALPPLVSFSSSTLIAFDDDRENLRREAEWDGERVVECEPVRTPVATSALAPLTFTSEPGPLVVREPPVGPDAARTEDVRAILYLPLAIEGKILGALTLQSSDVDAFSKETFAALPPIAAQLAIALNKAWLYRESRLYADELESRVAERTAELERAMRELEAFSYSVSHDLRAPLRHVGGFVDLLRRRAGAELDETSRRYLEIIEGATKRMGNLIDDLLGFSRIGRRELALEPLSLRTMVGDVLEELAPESEGRALELEIGELPDVVADRSLLRLVITNLLSNALKFTRGRAPARVEIGSERGDGEAVVYVKDNGVGFDMKHADKLFEVFKRLHRAEEFEGTGIGLANAARIVHRHGGRIWAASSPHEGATFFFTLPGEHEESTVERLETHIAG